MMMRCHDESGDCPRASVRAINSNGFKPSFTVKVESAKAGSNGSASDKHMPLVNAYMLLKLEVKSLSPLVPIIIARSTARLNF